jgi:sec-independent protein translocase protein TatA
MGLDNPLHIAFLLIVLLLVFGAKRLPEIGRSVGAGMREFKDSISGQSPALTQSVQQPQVVAQPPVAQPAIAQPAQPVAAAPTQPPVAQPPVAQPAVAQPAAAPQQPVAVPAAAEQAPAEPAQQA